jgi:ligand-binding sensor domain-containing protein/AraC-like DNA-binding protein
MKRFLRLFGFFCLFQLATVAAAQPPHTFTRYGRENNFSGTTVEDMAQDSHGQLWLATWGGLYAFDGRTFQNYRTDNPEDRSNPRSNHFTHVEVLSNDEVLVLSYDNRLYRFNPQTRVLDLLDWKGEGIQAIFRPDGDELYFLTADNEVLDASFSRFCRVREGATVQTIISNPDFDTWVLTDRGIYRNRLMTTEAPAFCAEMMEGALFIGSANGELMRFQEGQLRVIPTQLSGNITFITRVPDRPELLLGSDRRGIVALDLDNGTQYIVAQEETGGERRSYSSRSDDTGNLWVFPQQGSLFWYDKNARRLYPFLGSDTRQGWNSETGITSFFIDRQGNLWLGSNWGGLERIVFHRDNFNLLSLDGSGQVSQENSVRALLQDEGGRIFAATRDSRLHVLDESLRERASWQLDRPAYTLTRTHDGKLWAGTRGAGLMELTLQEDEQMRYRLVRYPKDDLFYGPNSNDIFSLLEDTSHRLWIGTFDDGIAYVDLDKTERMFISKRNRLSFPTDRRNRMRCLALSPDGRLYAGGQMGLFVCDHPFGEPENMHFERFSELIDYDIQHILFTQSGDLYVCSYGAGLLKLDGEDADSDFHAWTANEGLLSNYALSAIEDESGNIWIATQAGLNRLNPQTGGLIGFPYERLGLTLRFNEGSPCRLRNGMLCFNTSAGILYFNPAEISNDGDVPELLIQGFYVSGVRRDVDEATPIHILPKDGIRVQVVAVDLTAPEQILYSYKLDGVDKDWIPLGNRTSLSIDPLHPGKYTLRIRSTNGGGLAVDNERDFVIIVRRDLIRSGWFALFSLLFIGLLVFLLTRRLWSPAPMQVDETDNPLLHGLHGEDRRFVESFTEFLGAHLDDGNLDVPQICEGLGVSRSVLFGRCRALLGTTPATFLRRLRLERAQALIREGGRSMTDISYAVGINDPHYFSKIFKKEFGITPSEFKQQQPADQ